MTVGRDCRLLDVRFNTEPYLIHLGDHVSATSTNFLTHDGGVWVVRERLPKLDVVREIHVGNNVYFGYGCVVLPGVTVGDNVVVGACSVVSKDIPSNSVAVGVPARVIRTIDEYEARVIREGLPTKHLNASDKREFYLRHFAGTPSVPGRTPRRTAIDDA